MQITFQGCKHKTDIKEGKREKESILQSNYNNCSTNQKQI